MTNMLKGLGRRGTRKPRRPQLIQRTEDKNEKVESLSQGKNNISIGYPTGDGQS